MKAVVKHLETKRGQRLIAISDIHGNLEVFTKLLQKINFSTDDILILLGDMIEKGPCNLETLHYIMKLQETHQVYPLLGNCDAVILSLNKSDDNERLKHYLKRRRSTVLEMCNEVGLKYNEAIDIVAMKKKVQKHFQKELMWLESLPHIITAGNYIFTHAALRTENLEDNTIQDVLRQDAFMNREEKFSKTIVVGHWPVVLYDDMITQCNPIINRQKNIISIDGGNVLKIDGQLNALLIEDAITDNISTDSMDLLPRALINETTSVDKEMPSINIRWIDGQVEIIEEHNEFSYCRHVTTGYQLWVLNSYLYETKDGIWAEDCTDYILPVEAGDEVAVVEDTTRGYLVKKDGVVGWYTGKLTFL